MKVIDDMKPPASFLQAMEDYVKDAPRDSIVRKDQVQLSFLFSMSILINQELTKLML